MQLLFVWYFQTLEEKLGICQGLCLLLLFLTFYKTFFLSLSFFHPIPSASILQALAPEPFPTSQMADMKSGYLIFQELPKEF